MSVHTASRLLAVAAGKREKLDGPYRCFFCGGPCDDSESAQTWVKTTCTVRQFVGAADSEYVCVGCAMSMNEKASITDHAGEVHEHKRMRGYSWMVTADGAIAVRDRAVLTAALLSPPPPPYSITIAVSGQKHLLWMTPVNDSSSMVRITLEDEIITYEPTVLKHSLSLAESIAAAAGRPSLSEAPTMSMYRACHEYHGTMTDAEHWARIWSTPIGRLSAYLCPARKVCRERLENGNNGDVSARDCGPLFA